MIDLLAKYKELTIQQKDFLLQGEIDAATEIAEKKEELFVMLRDKYSQAQPSGTMEGDSDSKQLVDQILVLNKEVIELMQEQKDRLGSEMGRIQAGRQVQDVYGDNYSADAYFFDKKK